MGDLWSHRPSKWSFCPPELSLLDLTQSIWRKWQCHVRFYQNSPPSFPYRSEDHCSIKPNPGHSCYLAEKLNRHLPSTADSQASVSRQEIASASAPPWSVATRTRTLQMVAVASQVLFSQPSLDPVERYANNVEISIDVSHRVAMKPAG